MRMKRPLCGFAVGLALCLSSATGQPAMAASDAEIEACLSDGEILKGWEELVGLTKPLKLELECDGQRRKVVFKSLDVHKQGLYMLANGDREFNFSDSYKYEVAAYRLDRELGLYMVPVAVLRRYRGTEGALQEFIANTVHENQVSKTLDGAAIASLTRQRSLMHLFDSLIYNVDRRPPNVLINEETAKLYMIDHSQAFRERTELQEVFAQGRIWLPEEVYRRLRSLDRERLDELTCDLLTRGQRRTLMQRRDLILEKIDQDRQTYGDASVFIDP